ncbi:hypothetical protein N7470_004190 [Penicillium chermesinum]|nr:hypothetical protein N7470_004190 [Penicillium chermesinum]
MPMSRSSLSPGMYPPPRAQKLKAKHPRVVLIQGDLDQPDNIFTNAKKATALPIWGVFSVQVRGSGGSNRDDVEERQGMGLVDVALKNNIQFFVYSSVDRGGDASFNNPTIHHLVEKCQGSEMAWAILRSVYFMENINPSMTGKTLTTSWKTVVKDRPLQLLSVTDIGFFAAQAFTAPAQWRYKSISLAGDQLTFNEMAKVFKDKKNRNPPMTFDYVSSLYLWWVKDHASMFRWCRESGFRADIPAARTLYPSLKSFAAWLESDSGSVG